MPTVIRRGWCQQLYRLDTGEVQPRSSFAHRTRRVHQAIAHVLLAPAETLHGTTRARPATTSAGAFLSVQPSVPSVDHSSSSRVQAQAAEVEGAAVEQAPKYPEEERGDSTDPHADAQLFAVNDGQRSFSERADLRWQEVHEHCRADWRGCCSVGSSRGMFFSRPGTTFLVRSSRALQPVLLELLQLSTTTQAK
ncbi:uncharacterized protein LOC144122816 [Amblyomma americanum]